MRLKKWNRRWCIALAKKDALANLKQDVDKLEKVPSDLNSLKSTEVKLDKLATVSVDLSKLSNIVNKDVIKKDMYNTD